jgi:hypothetical protein
MSPPQVLCHDIVVCAVPRMYYHYFEERVDGGYGMARHVGIIDTT